MSDKKIKKVRTKKQLSEAAKKAVEARRINHPEWGQKKKIQEDAKLKKQEPDEIE